MLRKEKFVVLLVLMVAGLALIFSVQVWAQSFKGAFGEVIYEEDVKVVFDPGTGKVLYACGPCDESNPDCGNCGPGWVIANPVTLYILPTGDPSDARLVENVGPLPGCACSNCFYHIISGICRFIGC